MPLRRLAALAVAWAAVGAAPAHATDASTLQQALSRQAARLGPASGSWVADLDTGRTLWTRQAGRLLVPASNQKLYTTATALLTLGPTARRVTTVVGDGSAATGDGTVAPRDLYLVGAGDPGLSDAGLADLADQLTAGTGLRRVTGGVVGDERLLDGRRGSFDSRWAADLDLGGQLGALVVRHGATDAKGPAHLAAARLQGLLSRRGVRFGRAARTGTAPPRPVTASGTTGGAGVGAATGATDEVLAAEPSAPVSELIRRTNEPSDNFYAELLLKVVGAEAGGAGTTPAGLAVARSTLRGLGVRPVMVDGSGLSHANRTSPRQLGTLLTAMSRGAAAAPWRASLAVAGRSGTLRKRMRGTAAAGRCRGKTGTLRGVSALSGYCTTTGGRRLAFSLLENGVGPGAKRVEDRMVAAIARYSG